MDNFASAGETTDALDPPSQCSKGGHRRQSAAAVDRAATGAYLVGSVEKPRMRKSVIPLKTPIRTMETRKSGDVLDLPICSKNLKLRRGLGRS